MKTAFPGATTQQVQGKTAILSEKKPHDAVAKPRIGVLAIQGDYAAAAARWESIPIDVGTPLQAPTVIFRKLDPSIVEEELARLEAEVTT